jgi:hypothetical protein
MKTRDITHKRERLDDAVFAVTNLEHKHLSIERELVQLKWYGYRFLTPLAATKLFYDTYREQLVNYLREHKGKDVAEVAPRITFDDFTKNLANLTKAWTARQAADTFGLPYNLYIEFGIWFWSRRNWGGRRYAPQINQLGYSDKSKTAWLIEFEKFKKDRLGDEARLLASVPQLHPAAFRETSEQVAARVFLLELSRKSDRSWAAIIEKWCFSFPILTPESFATIVDADVIDDAIEKIGGADRASPLLPHPLPPGALWPSCHGMPGAQDPAEPACAGCKFADSCERLAAMVVERVRETTGHDQPRKVQLRAPANERQRRLRERKKLSIKVEVPAPHAEVSTHTFVPEAYSSTPEVLTS